MLIFNYFKFIFKRFFINKTILESNFTFTLFFKKIFSPILISLSLLFLQFLNGASLDSLTNNTNDISTKAHKKNIITFTSDNDVYFPPTDYDRYYTAGHRFDFTSQEFDGSFLRYFGLSSIFDSNGVLAPIFSRFSISLAQEIRVPNDKKITSFIPNDMPYSGYLYLNFGAINRIDNFLEQTSINLGLIGPMAMAKETQDFIHNSFNMNTLKGWDNQLQNEMIANLYYTASYKVKLINNIFDIIPRATLAIGNAYTHIDLGARFRLGYGLNNDFGFSTATSDSLHLPAFGDSLRIYLQGDISGRLVGHNIFLQGNTFNGVNPSIDINKEVYQMELGILLGYKSCSIAFSHVMKSKEFAQQSGNTNYASIRVEIGF